MQQCTQEHQNTKRRFQLITNVKIFAALLKNFPMGCPDYVLPEPLLRHTRVNCLLSNKDSEPYKDHLSLFRALAKHMLGPNDLDSLTFRYLKEIITKSGYDPKKIRGVCRGNCAKKKHIHFDVQEGDYVGELVRRRVLEGLTKQSNYCDSTIISFIKNMTGFFKCFRRPS